MRTIRHVAIAATLAASLAATGAFADEAPAPPAGSNPPAQPAQSGKITKSRSNIQNNREAPPTKDDAAATGDDQAAGVVKTKTKSNQSND